MSDDSFVREVDEAVRQEELKRLWDRYGLVILLGAVLIVGGVASYKGWVYWQAQRAANAGARFVGALTLVEDGKSADAIAAFTELAADGPAGYRILSRFQMAAAEAKAGRLDKAVTTYDELASSFETDDILKDFARVQAAALLVDTVGLQAMKDRIGALADNVGPWRHSAREYLGLTAYREGNYAEAEDYFTRSLVDPGIPPNMRRRAEMMLALVVKADAPAKTK